MSNDRIAESMNLTPLVPTIREIKPVKSTEDYESAKGNLDIAIETAMTAISHVAHIATSGEDPRAFRVLNELLTTIVAATKTQMELKQIDVEVKQKESAASGPQTVNQNLFIGSTQELADMLQKVQKKNEDI